MFSENKIAPTQRQRADLLFSMKKEEDCVIYLYIKYLF